MQAITIEVEVIERVASCDFCSQGKQDCVQSPNGSTTVGGTGIDICKPCIRKLALQLGMSLPVGGEEAPAPEEKQP